MSPGRSTKALLLANILLGFCALPLVDIPPTMAFTFAGLILPAFYTMNLQVLPRGYTRIWGAVAVGLVAAAGIEFIVSGKQPEQVLSFQIVCLILCRVYTVQEVRHLHHLPLLTFLLMLVVGIAGGSMLFPLIFLVNVATLAPLLVSIHCLGERLAAGVHGAAPPHGCAVPVWPERCGSAFRRYVFYAVAGTAATIAVFSSLPRLGPGKARGTNIPADGRPGNASTGMSEFLTLDRLSMLKRDLTEVMRVQVLGSAFTEEQLYLKGYVLEEFRPQTVQWRRTSDQSQEQIRVSGSRADLPSPAEEPRPSTVLVTQEISLVEPTVSGALFALPGLRGVSGVSGVLRVDDSGNCSFRSPEDEPVRAYTVYSDYAKQFVPRAVTGQRPDAPHPREAARCLEYPDGQIYDRVRELADRVCRSAAAESPYARVLAIQKHLISGYQYRLGGIFAGNRHPLESFLFRQRAGHCELFACAMALMLRSCGVPSRIVLGYHGGVFDAATNQFTIRQADAHAWVEACLPGAGWVAFDPTPPAPLTSYGERIAFKVLKDAASRFGFHWQRYFGDNQPVHPDTVGALRGLGAFLFANKSMSHPVLVDAFERLSDAGKDSGFRSLVISLGLVNMAAVGFVVMRRRRRYARAGRVSRVSDRLLQSILCQLADGRQRSVPCGLTAQEYVVRLALRRCGRVPEPMEELMNLYHLLRFGSRGVPPAGAQRVPGLLRQLRRELAFCVERETRL